MKFIDSHSQLYFPQYDADRDEVIARMREAEVGTITIGTDEVSSRQAVEMAGQYEDMWATVGIHPTSVSVDSDVSFIRTIISHQKVVAVGECGLDRFHEPFDSTLQEKIFHEHLSIAIECGKPLVLHCRKAYDEMAKILKQTPTISGVMHFFAGTVEHARTFLDMGLYLSFAGPVTFTDEYDRVIEQTPLERLLIETDAPFAAPAPYRGRRNEPAYVVEVAKKIAAVKKVELERVAEQTTANAKALFNL